LRTFELHISRIDWKKYQPDGRWADRAAVRVACSRWAPRNALASPGCNHGDFGSEIIDERNIDALKGSVGQYSWGG
jgi:hypothetical protein